MIRIICEIMQDAHIASEQIECDTIMRLYSAEKLDDLLARVCLILKARVQAVKEDDRSAGRRVHTLNTIGENVRRQSGPRLGRRVDGIDCKDCNLLLLAFVEDGEVLF